MGGPTKVNRREPESLPKLIVEYWPDTQTLSIRSESCTGYAYTITNELVAFYDAEGNPAGFTLDASEVVLKPFLDAVMSKHQDDKTKKFTKA